MSSLSYICRTYVYVLLISKESLSVQHADLQYTSPMSEIRDWLKILTYTVIGLLVLGLVDASSNDGEILRIITRETRTFF